ncbi:conserved hypothetical protein [Candida dubliniensis CD36]|uniref:Uncharacterized protein n=1 Tax=Candida dubliniensis (strain CD36 / ATCC MYA-646 / CBS 7987 / NCPF 3949 / NRRL Y-17841) TaxID=573826 RepID=B9WIU2_CANDC|nr:conserved hypothetical protein [Candida dubliniensis CD36]CAX41160.1 conserved hypothetical protein [Candida dubliniensis CD36]
MLRREATTIRLSPEDILEYDDSVAQQKQKQEQQSIPSQQNPSDFSPHNILQEQINNSSHSIIPDFKEETGSIHQRSRASQQQQQQQLQQSRDERIGIHRN